MGLGRSGQEMAQFCRPNKTSRLNQQAPFILSHCPFLWRGKGLSFSVASLPWRHPAGVRCAETEMYLRKKVIRLRGPAGLSYRIPGTLSKILRIRNFPYDSGFIILLFPSREAGSVVPSGPSLLFDSCLFSGPGHPSQASPFTK